jgi:hypothetical protein
MDFSSYFQKRYFVYVFFGIILILFVVRLIFPSLLRKGEKEAAPVAAAAAPLDSIARQSLKADSVIAGMHLMDKDLTTAGTGRKHPIYSVPDYGRCFPDLNDVQIATARRLGVNPVADRAEAEHSKDKLVYIGNSPYYYVKKLYNSIPYLVPRAQLLLTKIARNFLDSQYVKHINPSMIMVTSIMRTKADVAHLRTFNGNASENSCHCYGTTFDISYNKYRAVQDPDGPRVRQTRDDTLKYVLSEVLKDLRDQGACYVKYETHQGCYHITVR